MLAGLVAVGVACEIIAIRARWQLNWLLVRFMPQPVGAKTIHSHFPTQVFALAPILASPAISTLVSFSDSILKPNRTPVVFDVQRDCRGGNEPGLCARRRRT